MSKDKIAIATVSSTPILFSALGFSIGFGTALIAPIPVGKFLLSESIKILMSQKIKTDIKSKAKSSEVKKKKYQN